MGLLWQCLYGQIPFPSLNQQQQRVSTALKGNPSENYGASPAKWSYSVTCHPIQVKAPAITTAIQASTRFTYPGGMEGWVDLGGWLYTEMVYLSTDHPGSNLTGSEAHDQIDRKPNVVTIMPPSPPRQYPSSPTVKIQGTTSIGSTD